MSSSCYDSFEDKVHTGAVVPSTDTFYVMLLTSSYAPNFGTNVYRSDLTNEVTGTGYTAGGASASVSVALDTTNHKITVTLGGATWSSSTITARYAAYYKHRGGLATADELVALVDFGADVISSSGTFTLTSSTISIPTPA